MTGRERVTAALTFSSPDRVPRDLWVLPYTSIYRRQELDDFLHRYPLDVDRIELSETAAAERDEKVSKVGSYVDEWGSVWQVSVPGTIGEVREPAVSGWSKLASFQPPWGLVRNRDLDFFNRGCDSTTNFTIAPASARPFERLQFLRGTENVYLDLAMESSEFVRLLEMVHEFYLEDIRSWSSSSADGVFFMDDWGTQDSMVISPAMWRAIFKPLYREYVDIIHAAGKFAFFHTDGFVEPIYEDLVEIGLDAVNSQLFCMDIERLGERLRGRITFWGEIDRQWVLPFGTPADVRSAVKRVRSALDDGSGGVIAQCEWGNDNEVENIEAVYDAWM